MLSIQLGDDTTIYADGIVARRTYLGLIEGVPNDAINERMIDDLKSMCSRTFCVEQCVVLAPSMTTRQYRGKSWRALPSSAIGGLFRSLRPVRDRNKTYSRLAVLWFQNAFEPLLSRETLQAIQQLHWTRLAEDYED